MIDEVDDIAEELCPSLAGRTLKELREEFRTAHAQGAEFEKLSKTLCEVFIAASAERYKRMGVKVIPGNARSHKRIFENVERQPGEEGD